MFGGSKVPKHATLLFMMYSVRLRLTFNLRPTLQANEYCESQNLAKCSNIMEAFGKVIRSYKKKIKKKNK